MGSTTKGSRQTWPGSDRWLIPSWARFTNKVLAKLRAPIALTNRFDHREDMVSLEQVANFDLLITDLLEQGVPGEFVELGCYTGSTAVVFASLIKNLDPQRPFHVFDRFDIELGSVRGIREIFEDRIRQFNLPMPAIHEGDLLENVPSELPDRIAFAHIDLGTGGGPESHAKLIEHALVHVYPRIVPKGIMVFMDYHAPALTVHGNDSNPGVRGAVDAFFKDKPEQVRSLYGGACSHAYIRKR